MAESPARAGPTLLTASNTSQTIITASATTGNWTIIRDITIINETAAAVVVTYGIGTTNADAAGKRLLNGLTLQPNSTPYTWGGFLPLNGGATPDLLYALCSVNNGATITVGAVTGP